VRSFADYGDTGADGGFCANIPQSAEPAGFNLRLRNIDHLARLQQGRPVVS